MPSIRALLLACAVAITAIAAFRPTSRLALHQVNEHYTLRKNTARFGVNKSGESRKKKKQVEETSASGAEGQAAGAAEVIRSASSQSPSTTTVSAAFEKDSENALAAKYAAFTEKKVEALDDKIERLRAREEELMEDISVGAVPEIVANRMISRITAFLVCRCFLV